MNRIAWLEGKIAEASNLLAKREFLAQENAISRMAIESLRSHIGELRHDLYLAKAERAKELVTLRLVGADLDKGAIPLHLLARLASYFERAMGYASYRIQHGKDALKKVPEEIQKLLDLRLADIAFGSTELVITGNTRPDLAGDSLLESSLQVTFGLLESPDENLADRAALAGPKTSRMIGLMLAELERERCAADLRWTDSGDREYRWVAEPSRISHIKNRLSQLAEFPAETIVIDGEVELLSTTGRVVIRPNNGTAKISARFPRDLYQRVQALHLGERARFTLVMNRLFNPNTQQDVQSYTLISFGDEMRSSPAD